MYSAVLSGVVIFVTQRFHTRSAPALDAPNSSAPIHSPTVPPPVKNERNPSMKPVLRMMRSRKKFIRSNNGPQTRLNTSRATFGMTAV